VVRLGPSEAVPAAVALAAGMLGGSIGVGVAYPLDTIKVKIQAANAGSGGALGAVDVVRSVLRTEGVGGFYGGVSSTMAGQALIKGSAFLAYDVAKQYLPPFFAACASGAAATFIVTPVERVKVVMQASAAGRFAGPGACVRRIIDDDGVGGLFFGGFSATLLRECPSFGFYFASYEFVSDSLSASGAVPDALVPLLGGACAGVAAWLPVYPVDVVKTAQQAETGSSKSSALQVAAELYKKGGPGIFFDGLAPKLFRAVVNHGVTFFVVDQARSLWLVSAAAAPL